MPNTKPFEQHTEDYEHWFDIHSDLYRAEIQALLELRPKKGEGVEIGVGTGKFAKPLGISTGVEPSEKMAQKARKLNIQVIKGVAENLPFENESFDFAVLVTTICFVDNPPQTLKEARRILKPSGCLLLAFVDKESPLGLEYIQKKDKSKFYQPAVFFSTLELLSLLKKAGFNGFQFRQTIFGKNPSNDPASVKEGFGEGSFVVIRAGK